MERKLNTDEKRLIQCLKHISGYNIHYTTELKIKTIAEEEVFIILRESESDLVTTIFQLCFIFDKVTDRDIGNPKTIIQRMKAYPRLDYISQKLQSCINAEEGVKEYKMDCKDKYPYVIYTWRAPDQNIIEYYENKNLKEL